MGPFVYMRRTRTVEYAVEDDGSLRRNVKLSDGTEYVHRCTREHYEQVAYAFTDQQGHTLQQLAERLDLPFTQVNVAMEFLKERGCVVVKSKRRSYAASNFVFEDALMEYHAHRERDK
jgi:biotin operon repressor